MKYSQQLHYKQNEVYNNLKRIGKIEMPEFEPILGSEKQFFYRNKMEFGFSNARWMTDEEIQSGKEFDNKNALGFHIPRMWDKILDITKCHLQEDPSNDIRNEIRRFANENKLSFYNPRTNEGLLRTLMIRTASTGELMILIQFFENNKSEIELMMQFLAERFPETTSLQYVVNQKMNDTIYDQDIITFKGRNYILEEMEGLHFSINAKSFYQTNPVQAHRLYAEALSAADLQGGETVYDLYTGTGTIALFMAQVAAKVVGVESVPEAVAAAVRNAERNGITNTTFEVGDMRRLFTPEFVARHGAPDVVVVDPPREGMHPAVVAELARIKAPKLVYVSCNPSTQARDVSMLAEAYEVERVQGVDMFPQTFHVESVVLLRAKTAGTR